MADRMFSVPNLARLAARLTSIVSIATLVMFVADKSVSNAAPNGQEMVGFLFFPLGVTIGLVIAWFREPVGATFALISLAAFYIVYGALVTGGVPSGPWFLIFTSPAILFLASWVLHQKFNLVTRGTDC